MVNVKTNAHAPLKISGPVLAGIFLGTIKTWDAPAIKKLNPGIDLPSQPIVPIYRSDGSGTSYAFTDYLRLGQPGVEVEDRRLYPAVVPGRRGAPEGRPASPASSPRTQEASHTQTSPSRSRTMCR